MSCRKQGREKKFSALTRRVWHGEFRFSKTSNKLTARHFVSAKHHCRNCGEVVCAACSSKKVVLVLQSSKPLRVCDACFHGHGQGQPGSPSADDLKRMSAFSAASTASPGAGAVTSPVVDESATASANATAAAEDEDEDEDENDDDGEDNAEVHSFYFYFQKNPHLQHNTLVVSIGCKQNVANHDGGPANCLLRAGCSIKAFAFSVFIYALNIFTIVTQTQTQTPSTPHNRRPYEYMATHPLVAFHSPL
jgi:hypothetical protein